MICPSIPVLPSTHVGHTYDTTVATGISCGGMVIGAVSPRDPTVVSTRQPPTAKSTMARRKYGGSVFLALLILKRG